MYLKEKSDKETYKEMLNRILDTLKTFENIEVRDKIYNNPPLDKIRCIEIKQNDKYLEIALNLDALESEAN